MGLESWLFVYLEQARVPVYTVLWRMAKIPAGNNAKRVRIYHTIVVSSFMICPPTFVSRREQARG